MNTFEPVDKNVLDMANEVQQKYFPELGSCRYTILYDARDKKKAIAKIYKANNMIRFFTSDEVQDEDGYDYVIVLDKMFWTFEAITDEDRMRILRHEFRHAYFNPEGRTRNSQYKLIKHTVESFYEEEDLYEEEGTPRWLEKIGELKVALYDSEEDKKNNGGNN